MLQAAGTVQHAPLQLHATVLALQPRVFALQPSVPHLSHFTVSADSASVVFSNICVRRITYPNRPRTYTVHYFVSFRPPAALPFPPPHRTDAADAAHVTPRTTRPVPSLVTVLDGTQAEARQHRVPLRALAQVRPAAAREGAERISRPPVTPPWAPPHVDRQARLQRPAAIRERPV